MTTEPNLLMILVARQLINGDHVQQRRARTPRRGGFRRRARTPAVVPDR